MNGVKTLRERVSEISIIAFLSITVAMFTSFTLYSIKKTKITEDEIQKDLTRNIKGQVNLFLPSFLLPEQKKGMGILLDRIKKDESLEHALIIKDQTELPSVFSNCKLDIRKSVTCGSSDMTSTAVITPLSEMNQHFGFFIKTKKNSSITSVNSILHFAGIILFILGLTFIGIYLFITRLMSKTLPLELDNLVKWIEAEIHGGKGENIQLNFKELEDLKIKISEVFERYNKSRDQAIIGQLTSGIMHDIKTPLQSIVTALHLVHEQEPNSTKRLARLENLYRMSTNNLPLIGDIIETTLDGNRNIQVFKKPSDIRDTIHASIDYTKEFSRLRNVSIEVVAPTEIKANYDSLQFVRVLNNLLKNGIEAANESKDRPGKVRISISKENDSSVKLTVEDSGHGFSGSTEKIFRAFGTTKVRGTGLGLLITKKIVEAHDGRIEASNASIYGGAKMEVILPVGEVGLS